MSLSWHALNSMIQVKNQYHPEKQGLGYPWLLKRFSIFFWPTDRHTDMKALLSNVKCQMLIDITCIIIAARDTYTNTITKRQ